MFLKVLAVLSLAICVLGDGHAISEQKIVRHHPHGELSHIGQKAPEHHDEYAPSYPSYEFSYKVDDPHTHDVKGHSETRNGDEVKGEYWLYEPDGRKRTVKYHADKHSGFKAVVEYTAPHHHVHIKSHKHEDHKPIVEHKHIEMKHEEPKIELKHIELKPVHEEKKDHLPHIPALSLHRPRYHKYEEDGYHPRDYRRYNAY